MSFLKKLIDFLGCVLIVGFILFLAIGSYYLITSSESSMFIVILFLIFAWISRITDWF